MISVVIPVYNVKPYLAECLDSVIHQTFADLEIIVVDDGSTDGSGAICDAYAQKDARVRVVHQENQGLSAARNKGLDLATGEYICFADSDDYLMPDAIENLFNICRKHDADMAICSYKILPESGAMLDRQLPSPMDALEIYTDADKMDAYLRFRKISNAVWGRLYTAELFREIRFPVGRLYEDVFITYRLLHAAGRIANSSTIGYIYRKRPNSITTGTFTPKHFDVIEGRFEEMEFIRANYPHLLPYMHSNLIDGCIALTVKMASGGIQNPEIDRELQSLYRKYTTLFFLKHRHSYKTRAFALVACIHISLAKLASRCYHHFIKQ